MSVWHYEHPEEPEELIMYLRYDGIKVGFNEIEQTPPREVHVRFYQPPSPSNPEATQGPSTVGVVFVSQEDYDAYRGSRLDDRIRIGLVRNVPGEIVSRLRYVPFVFKGSLTPVCDLAKIEGEPIFHHSKVSDSKHLELTYDGVTTRFNKVNLDELKTVPANFRYSEEVTDSGWLWVFPEDYNDHQNNVKDDKVRIGVAETKNFNLRYVPYRLGLECGPNRRPVCEVRKIEGEPIFHHAVESQRLHPEVNVCVWHRFYVKLNPDSWFYIRQKMWKPKHVFTKQDQDTHAVRSLRSHHIRSPLEIWRDVIGELFGGYLAEAGFKDGNAYALINLDCGSPYSLEQATKIVQHVADHLNAGKPVYSEYDDFGKFLASLGEGEAE